MKKIFFLLTIALLSACNKSVVNSNENQLSGPYLGQTTPGDIPELFAPGIVSTAMYTRDIAIMPDGDEIYFCVSALGYNLIFYSRQIDGTWTEPAPATFIHDYNFMYYEPCISYDGMHLYFLSDMPVNKSDLKGNQDIWMVTINDNKWSDPVNLGNPVSTENAEFFPSITKDGTLYFSRQIIGENENFIYRSKNIDGIFQTPEKLGKNVNCGTNRFNAFVAMDESFMIIPAMGMEDSFGGVDYYLVFYDKEKNSWSDPVNMGSKINNAVGKEWSPYVSRDGNYFFYMASISNTENINETSLTLNSLKENFCEPQNGNASIYWVKADFIHELNPFK